jgi:stress response protein YsnF
VLVVEKRLMLREEVHVTRRREVRHDPQHVTIRREEAQVERLPGNGNGGSNANST